MGVISTDEWNGLLALLNASGLAKTSSSGFSSSVSKEKREAEEDERSKEKKRTTGKPESKNFFPPHMQKSDYIKKAREQGNALGLFAAGVVISGWWLGLYTALFNWDMAEHSMLANILLGLFNTYMYTGMFITAHDSMHGVVCPNYRQLNNFIGWFCVQCYAVFDYKKLLDAHWEHHRYSGQPNLDPDFHDGKNKSFFGWYFGFMIRNMQPVRQFVGMTVLFYSLFFLGAPVPNLIYLWSIPALLSSVQLFFFGTYIVHTDDEQLSPYPDKHNARSLDLPMWLHLLLCYNFMLHHEHHLLPFVPWWRLPSVALKLKQAQQQQQLQQQQLAEPEKLN